MVVAVLGVPPATGLLAPRLGDDPRRVAWQLPVDHAGPKDVGGRSIRSDWRGKADFLVRTDAPSALGGWSYEAWDSKLARHAT